MYKPTILPMTGINHIIRINNNLSVLCISFFITIKTVMINGGNVNNNRKNPKKAKKGATNSMEMSVYGYNFLIRLS